MKLFTIKVFFFSQVLLIAAGIKFHCFAQNNSIKFSNLSLKEGLSQSSVNTIIQDRKGFMWLGTQDGLNKYDGYTFTVFKSNPGDSTSISDNFINVIFEDREGNLWIGTEGGLNKFNAKTNTFTSFTHQPDNSKSLSSNLVSSIAQDKKGSLWIGTLDGGLNSFNPKTGIFKVYKAGPETGLSSGNIQSLYMDKQGTLWIGTIGGGLNKFNTETATAVSYQYSQKDPESLSNNFVWSIFEDKKGNLWVGTNYGLNKLNTATGKFNRYYSDASGFNSISGNVIRSIYEDNSGNLWIGSAGGGLNRFDALTGEATRFQHQPYISTSLVNNNVFSICQDRSGTLWLGTNKGISKFDNNKQNFVHYKNIPYVSNSIKSDVVWSIYEDEKKQLWIGNDEGLSRINRNNETVKHYLTGASAKNKHSNEKIYSIFKDHAGVLWVGTDGGIYRYSLITDKFSAFKSPGKTAVNLEEKRVYEIFEDRDHNLWIGTKEGLFILNPDRKKIDLYLESPNDKYSISNNVIRSVYQDKKGNIWIGTNGGGLNKAVFTDSPEGKKLSFVSYKSTDTRKNKNKPNNNIILAIHEDEKGVLWLGTYGGGLNRFDPETEAFAFYTEKDGLSNNVVYSIYSDKKGNLWMSTNRGISMFSPPSKTFNNYYENDGLQSNEFNIGAHFKSRTGEMFFGGINGFNAFYPENIRYNTIPPQIAFTGFKIFNKQVPIGRKSPLKQSITETKELVLSYRDDVITFEFAALHYSSSEKNKYAYMMEGFDEGWNYDDRRQVSYTNLDPGEYIFRVKAANTDGIWNEEGISLKITIKPPFWQTWPFRIIVAIAIIGFIIGIYKLRVKNIEDQKKELARQVKERTAEITLQKEKIESQKELIEAEKEKTEQLLLNILPQETVEELKNKGKASARHYRLATVMFTDFKNFTQIAESIRPKDLVAELDRYFIKFDEIVEKYGLEKIKTIGDAYMCAGGIPIRNKSNPIDMVLAGLEIQRYMEELRKEKEAKGEKAWELRIGIHTGELIAGVVGIKRFAYDIWGDTVNVASRLEGKGHVGKVNVSGVTYHYIKDYFQCTYRGKVDAKNKGQIDMYFVDKIWPELSENEEGLIPNDHFKKNLATALFYKINYKKAEQFILKKLEQELPRDLFYHGLHHTIDVRDAAEKIGMAEGIDGEDLMVLKTAAMYHDAGFVKEYFKNEPIGVQMAKEILPDFGYSPMQIKTVEELIMATQVPHNAQNLMEKIICDADLDYLGREDFHTIADTLKKELMARGKINNDRDWDALQIAFLERHQYYTETAKKLREPIKKKHLEEIKKRYTENRYGQENLVEE